MEWPLSKFKIKQKEHVETCSIKTCSNCGCPVEGLTLVCPRCREPISGGCSGKCSNCGKK